jgi:DNA invertase Pin-like site-specific DNA recombinase
MTMILDQERPKLDVALYARVSTDKCDECGKGPSSHNGNGSHEFRGQDPEVQLRELRNWCAAQGHTIVIEYVDRGISGTKASRPQLDQLMRDGTKGLREFGAVVVLRLDRFGRSVQHLHNAVGALHSANVAFISIKEGFDLTTPMGKLFFGILAAFAEFERNVIAERTKEGLKLARAKGHRPGRKIDPAKGPSRTTLWRQRHRSREIA